MNVGSECKNVHSKCLSFIKCNVEWNMSISSYGFLVSFWLYPFVPANTYMRWESQVEPQKEGVCISVDFSKDQVINNLQPPWRKKGGKK